ncbi:MAG: formylglycine-generating enzyme family protein [Planctomycetota bacterium]|jgi:formylglycine-generating enzyme required for sulfatase activity
MKLSLPLKLAIAVIVIFALTITGLFLYRPLKIRYYAGKYENSADPAKRIRIVDILCACGDKGKKALYQVFRKRCISEQVKIPAGSFMMGSEKGRNDEKPVHKVTLSSFWMDKFEVTNEKYYVFIKSTGQKTPHTEVEITEKVGPITQAWNGSKIIEGFEQHPVANVIWEDAKAYADWLGMKLPTEAQWEYACRAGSKTEYCFGDNKSLLDEYGWCSGRNIAPYSVGRKKPNTWGLYDMHGNVFEYCSDWYILDYYSESPASNPQGPEDGSARVIRGGYWDDPGFSCRSASRYCISPEAFFTRKGNGFRLARDSE